MNGEHWRWWDKETILLFNPTWIKHAFCYNFLFQFFLTLSWVRWWLNSLDCLWIKDTLTLFWVVFVSKKMVNVASLMWFFMNFSNFPISCIFMNFPEPNLRTNWLNFMNFFDYSQVFIKFSLKMSEMTKFVNSTRYFWSHQINPSLVSSSMTNFLKKKINFLYPQSYSSDGIKSRFYETWINKKRSREKRRNKSIQKNCTVANCIKLDCTLATFLLWH